jgi:hypothetical protein
VGDRGNIFFVDAHGKQLGGVYMYSHWGGSTLWSVVRSALERGRGRWGDPQYLARIIFCELVRDSLLDETGYGLSTSIGDNEHAIVRIDDDDERVSFHKPGKERNPSDRGVASWSYSDYLAAPLEDLERAFLGGQVDAEDEDEPAAPPKARANVKVKVKSKVKVKVKVKAKAKAKAKKAKTNK